MSPHFSNFIAWLSPRSCALCGGAVAQGKTHMCANCHKALPLLGARCPRCATPTFTGDLCGACLKRPPAFMATFCAYRYAFPLNRLIQDFKYGKRLALTHTLALLLLDGIAQHTETAFDVIVPMSQAPCRQIERGFNQSRELAREVARAIKAPIDYRVLRRVKDAPKQATLSLKERRKNVKDAFLCAALPARPRVLLIDDVMTTGATADAAATAILKAGAAQVTLAVVARSV